MLIGVVAGMALRGVKLRGVISGAVTLLIWLLLFVLGVEVGHNRMVIENIATLGLEGFFIAVMCVAGSSLAAWLLWRYARGGKEHGL